MRDLTVDRRYPLETLVRYGVSFCVQALPDYRPAQNRIVLPISMDNMLVGWQCRWVGEDFKAAGRPKFYSLPGMPKRQMLYNWDTAKQYPFIVVCEGIMSSWNVGPYAVALLGKTCAAPQQGRLTIGRQQPIILLLDGGEEERQAMYGITLQMLNMPGAAGRAVIPVELPDGVDPGMYDPRTSQALLGADPGAHGSSRCRPRLIFRSNPMRELAVLFQHILNGTTSAELDDQFPFYSFDAPGMPLPGRDFVAAAVRMGDAPPTIEGSGGNKWCSQAGCHLHYLYRRALRRRI